ncbi:hypothetical protein PIB30_072781, partial [Stylosanthes scabra]|nr:hypothetical protein [Stylosanthes scabra]
NGKSVSFSLFRFLENSLLSSGELLCSLDGFRGQCCFSGLPFQELPQSCFQLVNGVVPLIDPFLRGRQRVAFGGSLVGWYLFHRRVRVTGACDSYSSVQASPQTAPMLRMGP